MVTRTLGASGLRVTALGLGLAALGRPAYIDLGRDRDLGPDRTVVALRRRTHEVLSAACEAGVGYVDVARSYGSAEEFLASWMAEHPEAARSLTVGSKWGYTYTGGWRIDAPVHEVKDHSLASLRRQYAESRALLGPHLHIYQIHSATLESGVLEDGAVLAELLRMRADGLVIGLTVSGPEQAATIRRALAVRVDGVNPFGSVQATWNLLEPSAGPALAEAHAAGLGVILKEVLANGRLAGRGLDVPDLLRRLAGERGIGLDRLAVAAALANPWADVVLTGAVTVDQLAANLEAVDLGDPGLDPATVHRAAEVPDLYWAKRRALPWR
ncbi:MAG TPA: aldo/keto reductase [Candidatus Dormibacteraeota bacterium]|nr:aldo/keto reductase [Candidatus Dormibacteraeota bacterium]